MTHPAASPARPVGLASRLAAAVIKGAESVGHEDDAAVLVVGLDDPGGRPDRADTATEQPVRS